VSDLSSSLLSGKSHEKHIFFTGNLGHEKHIFFTGNLLYGNFRQFLMRNHIFFSFPRQFLMRNTIFFSFPRQFLRSPGWPSSGELSTGATFFRSVSIVLCAFVYY